MKVVVFSCDMYLWLMPIFLLFYRRNWPDNPYQTELVSETEEVKGITTFCPGKLPWANRVIKYLESFNEETFLLLVEDYILNGTVDTNIVRKAESLCMGDIGCVRLHAYNYLSHHLIDTGIEGFKEYLLDKPYAISLQASVWQKEFFLEFSRKGESIWQTETEGTKRVRNSKKKVIWTDLPAINYYPCGYMSKGVVKAEVAQWVKENW